MSFRKTMLIILCITVTIFLISLTSSYAWYTYSGGSTDFDSVVTDADLNIIYAQSQIITSTTNLPIKDSEKEKYADKNIFTITSPQDLEDYQIMLTIYLIKIEIDKELKTESFKYELLQNNEIISSGTGLDIVNDSLILKDNIEIDPKLSYTYTLRIWLSETKESQNELMNKKFKAQIQVDSIAKK